MLLIGALALLVYAQTLPAMQGQQFGPGVFPTLVGAGLGITALILTIRGLAAGRRQALVEIEDGLFDPRGARAVAIVLGGVVFYLLASDWLGFLIVAPLVLLALFRSQRVGWVTAIVVAVVGSVMIHFAFYSLLRVPLPWGILTPIAW
ncbi:tripartite tricarboxylate transporter TctB family protein [Allostella humosa]|uniref:tripartite tricarboxylate transporter TctB family protein n=1 Tax=Stella humosa TaxID=94 RepID=UPI0014772EA4|nr:tripartite tricarboxylate transporter TctB family protein [Stella humosa]